MRHPVSPNQIVLWPHHDLTQAWAPTGILHPPQRDVPEEVADDDGQTTEHEATASVGGVTSALNCAHGGRERRRPARRRTLDRGRSLRDRIGHSQP